MLGVVTSQGRRSAAEPTPAQAGGSLDPAEHGGTPRDLADQKK